MDIQQAHQPRRRAATRERLLDAAREVLAAEGIQGASVEQICDQAGFTRGAFYSNFSSKEDLILAMFHREKSVILDKLRDAADPEAIGEMTGREAFSTIVDRFLRTQPADREWFIVHSEFAIHGLRDHDVRAEFAEAWQETKREFCDFMAMVLERIGRKFTIEPDHATVILMGSYEIALRESFIAGDELDAELLSETLPTILLSVTEPVAGRTTGPIGR